MIRITRSPSLQTVCHCPRYAPCNECPSTFTSFLSEFSYTRKGQKGASQMTSRWRDVFDFSLCLSAKLERCVKLYWWWRSSRVMEYEFVCECETCRMCVSSGTKTAQNCPPAMTGCLCRLTATSTRSLSARRKWRTPASTKSRPSMTLRDCPALPACLLSVRSYHH